jgi:hypothetical protein
MLFIQPMLALVKRRATMKEAAFRAAVCRAVPTTRKK